MIEIQHVNYFDRVSKVEYSTATDIGEWEFKDVSYPDLEETMTAAAELAEMYVERIARASYEA